MSAITRRGVGAPLVSGGERARPWTLLAVCGRDRAELVVPALASIRRAWPDHVLAFHRDPLDTELGALDLDALGVTWCHSIALDPALSPRARVAAMRADAALRACASGFQRVLFLDSDVLVDPDAAAELERLWGLRPSPDSAVSLTRCAVYDTAQYVRSGPTLEGATLRTHGLGMALAFPCSAALQRAAQLPIRGSWDQHFCATVALHCVVTPDVSWAIHEGRHTGICTSVHPGLDVEHPTPFLRARWERGRKTTQHRADASSA